MDSATLASLPVAVLLTRDGKVVAANPAYEELMGFSADVIVGRTVLDLVHEIIVPPDAPAADRAARASQEGRATSGTMWCRVTDARGHRRSLRVVWGPTPGDPTTSMVFLLDDGGAHEAKDAAEALARAGSELSAARDETEVLERAADALAARGFTVTFLLIDEDDPWLVYGPTRSGKQTEPSRAFEHARVPRDVLTQLNPRFHEGRAVFLQQLRDSVERVYEADVAADLIARHPTAFVMQAPLFVSGRAYGAFVLTSEKLSPAVAGAAEIFAALVARAIENVRMRVDLVQKERLAAIGEAAAIMAHEVRNPVAALVNAATLLRRHEGSSDELLTVITDEASSLERIVSDLLSLGRPISPRLASQDLRELAARAIEVARSRHSDATIRLHDGESVTANVDADLVQIAVYNVLRNALQASPPGAEVDVFVEVTGAGPRVRIDDRGPGIPTAVSQRAFEPFYTTRPAGTGIGLAAVRRIVEACGGNVTLGATPTGGGRLVMTFQSE